MQFSTFVLSALSIGSTLAQSGVTVHVVKVGNANGTLAYSPNSIAAAVGDMVQFQFAPANHTVTQSTFDQPCQPIAMNSPGTEGIYSGFMPVSATSTTTPTYTIVINNTTPIWVYCSQGKHCQNGMTMVINVNPTANATRTLANFQALAAKATVNLPGTAVEGGIAGTNTTSTTSSTSSTTSSATGTKSSSGAVAAMKASEALGMGALLAMGVAVLL